jgi:hypothetical protein
MPPKVTQIRRYLAVFGALLTLTASAQATASRRVIWVTGEVTARQLGERKARPHALQATDPLHGQLKIDVSPGGALWFLDDHRQLVGLHGPATWDILADVPVHGEGRVTRVSVESIGLERAPVVPWIELQRVHRPEAQVRPVSPVETGITTRRPVLRWHNEPGALRVSLTLVERSSGGAERLVETWQGLTGSRHEVQRPLKSGRDYAWRVQVDGARSETSTPSSDLNTWFHVLSEASIQSARRADATISGLQLDYPEAAQALEVLRALTWERHGLATEARAAWDELTEEGGDVEALRLYRARLVLRALARPRAATKRAP